MNLQDLILPSYAQMLEALAGQLDKAKTESEAKGDNADTILPLRLAPDMLPLSSQVQFACLQAEEVLGRLLNTEIKPVGELTSFDEAKTLLSETVERLRSAASNDASIDEARVIELNLPDNLNFDLNLAEYVRSWSLPQFYFHLITAYAIMRKAGINLGKADYVPHMFRFVRG